MKATSYRTLKKVLVTERAYALANQQSTYVFSVDVGASKTDIIDAILDVYGVRPVTVRTSVLRGKTKRTRLKLGQRPKVKKAFVKVPAGTTLPVYEEI